MKPELLAPAGNMESLKAAISAGCDAVYLAGYMFGARSFAGNFSNEELKEAVIYAHLRGVRVYVTVNTLVFEKEVDMFINYIDYLVSINVDALIIQDLGMFDLVHKRYPDLEIHASTQMHIHNLEGALVAQRLGIKRAVLARETDIETVRKIKENTNIELEIFIHGALCISYSGECFMSRFIGGRSGNRGTCAQSCRQKYTLYENDLKLSKEEYLLSTKDLNTLEHIGELIDANVDSLKIEGRMKRPEYVYFVTSLYRKAIDSYIKNKKIEITDEEIKKLKKLFNRKFTKGFLFNEDNNNFTNTFRPNHLGIKVGKVISSNKKEIKIKLSDDVNIGDGIRILDTEDYGLNINNMYINGMLVKSAKKNDIITIPNKGFNFKDNEVVKTTDIKELEEIQTLIKENDKRIKIDMFVKIKQNEKMELVLKEKDNFVKVTSEYTPEVALNKKTEKSRILEQLNKLNDTCYTLDNIEIILDDNLFVSIKEINELRRSGINLLNEKRTKRKTLEKCEYKIDLKDYESSRNLNFYPRTLESYKNNKNKKFNNIYLENDLYNKVLDERKILKIPRIMKNYQTPEYALIGELGGILNRKDFETDFSIHVTNSYTLAFLHSLGASKVTLSYELEDDDLKDLMESYKKRYNRRPNASLIVSGYLEAMVTKYNLYKKYPTNKTLYLKDRFNNSYKLEDKKDYMIIFNKDKRNLKDYDYYYNLGINNLRIEE